jgi:hypothetical protein
MQRELLFLGNPHAERIGMQGEQLCMGKRHGRKNYQSVCHGEKEYCFS